MVCPNDVLQRPGGKRLQGRRQLSWLGAVENILQYNGEAIEGGPSFLRTLAPITLLVTILSN